MTDRILSGVIATAMRGDDKYKRWPLAEMCAADDRITALEAERDALAEQIKAMEDGMTAIHMAGYMDGKKAGESERDALANKLEMAVECIKDWQSAGCPYCQGDCVSANPPIAWCIMAETRATLTALEDKTDG
jgi:hypothetical protein